MKRTSIYMYYSIVYFFLRIAFLMGLYVPKKIETFLDLDQKYILPLKTRFLELYNNVDNKQRNSNIELTFYDKKEFSTCVMEIDNQLEKIWRSRIIFENTPRGNVIMFYDAYKLGFSFFCDQNVVSYDILNGVAMKYVRIFNCCDFFIDESITPINQSSPFIKLHFLEDEKKNKPGSLNNNGIDGNSAFVKLRNYSKENSEKKQAVITRGAEDIKDSFFSQLFPSINNSKNDVSDISDKRIPEKMKNKFVYLGKIHNFKMTQPVPKKNRVLMNFTSSLMENIRIDSNVQRQRISYSDFKKSMMQELILEEKQPIIAEEKQIVEDAVEEVIIAEEKQIVEEALTVEEIIEELEKQIEEETTISQYQHDSSSATLEIPDFSPTEKNLPDEILLYDTPSIL